MFSVIFPGQGSQIVGMGKEFFDKHEIVKKLFKEADDILEFNLSKLILDGPKEELDLTANTQPAIFLVSYSIFNVIKKEFNINLDGAKYFAGIIRSFNRDGTYDIRYNDGDEEDGFDTCGEIVYPVTVEAPNGDQFTGNSEEEIMTFIEEWSSNNCNTMECDTDFELVFPITMEFEDDQGDIIVMTIQSEDMLEEITEQYCED